MSISRPVASTRWENLKEMVARVGRTFNVSISGNVARGSLRLQSGPRTASDFLCTLNYVSQNQSVCSWAAHVPHRHAVGEDTLQVTCRKQHAPVSTLLLLSTLMLMRSFDNCSGAGRPGEPLGDVNPQQRKLSSAYCSMFSLLLLYFYTDVKSTSVTEKWWGKRH